MRTTRKLQSRAVVSAVIIACLALGTGGRAVAASSVAAADSTLQTMRKADAGIARFIESSAGYAVFPTVGKGGAVFGGGYGQGIVYERGKPIGHTSLTQVTFGLQVGGQSYSEIIFFQDEAALAEFKRGELEFAAQVSAVALKSGASANAKYDHGVAVFTIAKNGLMVESSVGGQKFNYKSFAERRQ